MTFDDGILKIYERVLVQDKGFMPVSKLHLKSSYYFSYEVIGVTKFYEAKKTQDRLDESVSIYRDRSITYTDVVVLEDGTQYQISQIQHTFDDNGIQITKLTLMHLNEKFEFEA